MGSGRNFGKQQFFHAVTVVLDSETPGSERVTVEVPACEMFRVAISSVAEGASARFRGVRELQSGGADPADMDVGVAVAAGYAAPLDATNPDSGWIPAQPSAVRIEAVGGTLTATFSWLSEDRPKVA